MHNSSLQSRLITAVVSVAIVSLSLGFYFTDGFGMLSAQPRESLEEYQWGELKLIANMIAAAESDEEGIEIAKRFNLCREDGTLDPANVKTVRFSDGSGKQTLRIIGFRHDKVVGKDAVYGITFCFTGSVGSSPMNDAEYIHSNTRGWESSILRETVNKYIGSPPSTKDKFPIELGRLVSKVEKRSVIFQADGSSNVIETADKVFILSHEELFGTSSIMLNGAQSVDMMNAQNEQYQFFREALGANEREIFLQESCPFWLRTCSINNISSFLGLKYDRSEGWFPSNEKQKVVVGFCL